MKSPFFSPVSDPLTVTSSHNELYWLMLFVRTEAIHEYKLMYYVAISVENSAGELRILLIFLFLIPALVIGFGLHIHGFVRFWKLTAIHINFLLVTASTYAVLIIGSISRLITILYETRILQLSGLYEAPIPFLAVLRQSSYAQAFSLLWLWTIERAKWFKVPSSNRNVPCPIPATFFIIRQQFSEFLFSISSIILTIDISITLFDSFHRACATILVEDYEKHSRLYISMLLNAIFIPASYATGYALVTRILNAVNVTAVCFIPNIFFAGLTRWLIGYNERRLSRLVHKIQRHPDDYSLSLRLQLKENISSLKKIEFGVYLLTFGLAANLSFVAIPIVILTEPDQFETLQWLTCAGNVVRAFSTKSAPVNIKVMDNYFNQLESQWSDKLNMGVQKY
ncbi:hypothetical protein PRIPAC_81931 [Pristionchus pacificus]|uniref:G protein-coupled receptor n=1 Tax=Pristionchus pacificus TaxID=54126 RepID=A0A2A6CL57_PRIPA|nr:hypothetical protein PRIPAC_81931 [Pristionchus pacificus]|eukprot:PDM78828.1 G protein-coupled receptor [Pristionchus pacificus]